MKKKKTTRREVRIKDRYKDKDKDKDKDDNKKGDEDQSGLPTVGAAVVDDSRGLPESDHHKGGIRLLCLLIMMVMMIKL